MPKIKLTEMKATNNNPRKRRVRGLKESTVVLLDQFTALIGRKNWSRIFSPCTGKWKGTTDYGVQFEDGLRYYISNGMSNFEEKLTEQISFIHNIRNNREKYLQILRDQAVHDNAVAATEGLYSVSVIDMDIYTESGGHFLWAYVVMEVNGKQFKFTETNMYYYMKNNQMEVWIESCRKPTFTAGAVQNPDFIFSNVRFSSSDRLYKINEIPHN